MSQMPATYHPSVPDIRQLPVPNNTRSGIIERHTYKTDNGKLLNNTSVITSTNARSKTPVSLYGSKYSLRVSNNKTGNSSKEKDIRTVHCDSTTDIVENVNKNSSSAMEILHRDHNYPKILNKKNVSLIPSQTIDIDSDSDCEIVDFKKDVKTQLCLSLTDTQFSNIDEMQAIEQMLTTDSIQTRVLAWIANSELMYNQCASETVVISDSDEETTNQNTSNAAVKNNKVIVNNHASKLMERSHILEMDLVSIKSDRNSSVNSLLSGFSSNDAVNNTSVTVSPAPINSTRRLFTDREKTPTREVPASAVTNTTFTNKQNNSSQEQGNTSTLGINFNKSPVKQKSPSKDKFVPQSPDTAKTELYSYLQINTKPSTQEPETGTKNRRSKRVKNLNLQIEKAKELNNIPNESESDSSKKHMKCSKDFVEFASTISCLPREISDFDDIIKKYFYVENIDYSGRQTRNDSVDSIEISPESSKLSTNRTRSLISSKCDSKKARKFKYRNRIARIISKNQTNRKVRALRKLQLTTRSHHFRSRRNLKTTATRITSSTLENCKLLSQKMLKITQTRLKLSKLRNEKLALKPVSNKPREEITKEKIAKSSRIQIVEIKSTEKLSKRNTFTTLTSETNDSTFTEKSTSTSVLAEKHFSSSLLIGKNNPSSLFTGRQASSALLTSTTISEKNTSTSVTEKRMLSPEKGPSTSLSTEKRILSSEKAIATSILTDKCALSSENITSTTPTLTAQKDISAALLAEKQVNCTLPKILARKLSYALQRGENSNCTITPSTQIEKSLETSPFIFKKHSKENSLSQENNQTPTGKPRILSVEKVQLDLRTEHTPNNNLPLPNSDIEAISNERELLNCVSPEFIGFENDNSQKLLDHVQDADLDSYKSSDTDKNLGCSAKSVTSASSSLTTNSTVALVDHTDKNFNSDEQNSVGSSQIEVPTGIVAIQKNNHNYIPLNRNIKSKSFHKSLLQTNVKRKPNFDVSERSSLFDLSDSDSSISSPKKNSPGKKSQTHKIDITEGNGSVFNAYYVHNMLIIVQQHLITFWKQTALGNILGAQTMWIPSGSLQRLGLDPGCVNRRSSEMTMNVGNSIAYIELWTKEHKCQFRECPIADVFATIYYHKGQGQPDKKVLQLENIKGYGNDVRFAVVKYSREIIVSWCDKFSKPTKTLVRSYELAPDFQMVCSVKEMESVSHYISSLHNIQDCENLVLGADDENISIWNLTHGYLVITLNLTNAEVPTPLKDKAICLYVQCDSGFLFLVQQINVGLLRLVAINGITHEWKQLHSYEVPSNYEELLGVIVESGVLMTCYTNGFLCWNMYTGDLVAEIDTSNDQIVLPCNKHVVVIKNYTVTLQHVLSYILTHDWHVRGSRCSINRTIETLTRMTIGKKVTYPIKETS